jgi:cellobiose transport system permease protein
MVESRTQKILIHVLLVVGVAVSIFPLYWLIVMSTNSTGDIYKFPPTLTFGDQLLANLKLVFADIDFAGSFLNTVFVAGVTTLLVLFFDSLAGFTFAKFRFPGRDPLFVFLLLSMMVPSQLAVVPLFVVVAHLGWVASFKALIIPSAANAYGIFWLRQYAEGAIPDELLDSARMDGSGHLRLYWHVALPLLRPALAFLGIFTFVFTWNDYLWPLIVLTNPQHLTLQVALSQLDGIYSTNYSEVMAGTMLATLPLLVVFLIGSRQFIADLARGAIRG